MGETELYSRDGYVPLAGLFAVDVLHAFYHQLQSDFTKRGQSIGTFTAQGPLLRQQAVEIYGYQYPPLLAFLWGLTPRISAAAGCDLLPTYGYFRAYKKGDICRVHSDRLACEHSLSLTVAYGSDLPWALSVSRNRLDQPSSRITEDFGGEDYGSVPMRPGDGVLYQGIHHRHGRTEPNPNSWSAHLFLHWVDSAGPYREQAFDRPTLRAAGLA